MPDKIALIIDGAFLKKKLEEINGSFPTATVIVDYCNDLLHHADLSAATLFRAYYYDAYPLETVVTNPLDGTQINLAVTAQARQNKSLIETLELQPHFAVRKGSLACHGWKIGRYALKALLKRQKTSVTPGDIVPDIEQKGVDIKIGLDIAWIASKRIVDIILIISGDLDIVPAMKLARKEGLKVYLNTLGHSVNREMKVHADLVVNTVTGG